jgi:hypothetical protein
MENTTMKITASLALAAVLLASAAAQAEETPEKGCFGLGDYMILSLHGAGLSQNTVGAGAVDPSTGQAGPAEEQELSGNFGIFRFTVGGYMRATRFRSLVGAEMTIGLGWLGTSAVVKDETQLEGMTWGRYYFDMDTGLTLMVLERFGLLGMFDARLSAQGGVGFNNDMRYVYTGARLATNLPFGLEGEGSYQYRWGSSYSGGDASEHRLGATLIVPNKKNDGGWGLTGEVWRGDQQKTELDMATMTEHVVATPGRAFKGEYTVVMLGASIRWR